MTEAHATVRWLRCTIALKRETLSRNLKRDRVAHRESPVLPALVN